MESATIMRNYFSMRLGRSYDGNQGFNTEGGYYASISYNQGGSFVMRNNRIRVGLMGVSIHESNKGCEALGYSVLEILNQIAGEDNDKIDVYLFQYMPMKKFILSGFREKKIIKEYMPEHSYDNLRLNLVFMMHLKDLLFFPRKISEMSCIFDYTGGDSFSDIYGKRSFISSSKLKLKIIRRGIPLVLGSQTIGPFSDDKSLDMACEIIKSCHQVYVRDSISEKYVCDYFERKPILGTDVAFGLPYKKYDRIKDGKNIGINVSGLLWDDAKNGNKRFHLKMNYIEYCEKIINFLLNQNYCVHLVLHAFDENLSNPSDNDYVPYLELREKFPETVPSPLFKNCIEAKSYIAKLDILIAARMHATIGAISSGTIVIPTSYSRKFEGLYSSINYPYIINAREQDTETALALTKEWINNSSTLGECGQKSAVTASRLWNEMKNCMKDSINSFF